MYVFVWFPIKKRGHDTDDNRSERRIVIFFLLPFEIINEIVWHRDSLKILRFSLMNLSRRVREDAVLTGCAYTRVEMSPERVGQAWAIIIALSSRGVRSQVTHYAVSSSRRRTASVIHC